MAANSKIEWTEATWNPIVGCSIVSPGCTNCYAMKMAARCEAMGSSRYGTLTKKVNGNAVWTGKLVQAPIKTLLEPLRRRKPTTYFVNSMGDLFHEAVPDEWIDPVFAVAALCPQHTLQVLTKRSARMRAYLSDPLRHNAIELAAEKLARGPEHFGGKHVLPALPLPNVWLGVSTERQQEANERIPDLLATPAAVRFISAEPLLGAIDVGTVVAPYEAGGKLDWIITGGESGHDARPMHPDWVRSLRDQCAASGVPFFFKQWGAWKPIDQFTERVINGAGMHGVVRRDGRFTRDTDIADPPEAVFTFSVGKKRAGRLLDGIKHNGMPRSIGSQQ